VSGPLLGKTDEARQARGRRVSDGHKVDMVRHEAVRKDCKRFTVRYVQEVRSHDVDDGIAHEQTPAPICADRQK
jgi:hypothetical protein